MRQRYEQRRMLIVEDDPTFATAVETAGAKLNITADRAGDGWEAIEKLEENDYSLIVLDLDVPKSSGFGVVTFLRQEFGHALDNLIVMSRSDESSVRAKLHEQRCRVITKTDSVDHLTRVISDVI